MMSLGYGFIEGIAGIVAVSFALYLVIAFVLAYFAADSQARRAGGASIGLFLPLAAERKPA